MGQTSELIELGPTRRSTLKHLFGIAPEKERRHEEKIRRTPPFTQASIVNGYVLSPICGVVLKVVTSTGSHSTKTTSQFMQKTKTFKKQKHARTAI